MNKLILAAICLSVSVTSSRNSFAAETGVTVPALPAEARAILPAGATSFLNQIFPLGPNPSEILVHIWGTIRPNTPASFNSYNRFLESPFCVDIFEPSAVPKGQYQWKWVGSATFSSANPPLSVSMFWLQPKLKKGVVLDIIASSGAPGVSTSHTVLTWSKGVEQSFPTPVPQVFWSGGSGGGNIALDFKETDADGFLNIRSTNSYVNQIKSITEYHWDGTKFVAQSQGAKR